jgi:hypothetical protein
LASTQQFNLREICGPILEGLSNRTGDTSFLFVRSGNDAVCLSRVQGTYPIQTSGWIPGVARHDSVCIYLFREQSLGGEPGTVKHGFIWTGGLGSIT